MTKSKVITLDDALRQGPPPPGNLAAPVFEPGSFIFVPAQQEHRFESFSADFAVWVFFYGPMGGERSG